MIVKMCTWKIAENTSLANRLNKRVNHSHITVKTIQGPTSTWLFDTGADVTVLAMRELKKNNNLKLHHNNNQKNNHGSK
jgi:hypothetical protein